MKELSDNLSELTVAMEKDSGTVRTLLNALSKPLRDTLIDPKTGDLAPGYTVAVNGKLASLNSAIKENDIVAFIPALDGG